MKRNFLLLLLMALLPLVSWADENPSPWASTVVKAGDYDVTLSAKYLALTDATAGVAAPTVTTVSKTVGGSSTTYETELGVVVNSNHEKVATPIKAAGLYYQTVYITEGTGENAVKKVLYVPFYVAAPAEDHVYDKTTFDASLENGFYKRYYQIFPWCDVWYQATETTGQILYPGDVLDSGVDPVTVNTSNRYSASLVNAANDLNNEPLTGYVEGPVTLCTNWAEDIFEASGDVMHSWNATGQSNPDMFCFYVEKLLLRQLGAPRNQEVTLVRYMGRSWALLTDGTKQGYIKTSGEDATPRVYGGLPEGEDTYPDITMLPASGLAANGYNTASFHVLLVPAVAFEGFAEDVLSITGAVVNYPESYEYNAAERKPIFSGTGTDSYVTFTFPAAEEGADPQEGELEEGVDYTVSFPGTDYVHAGTKTFTITGIGRFAGSLNKTYTIIGKRVIINAAYTYKTYGESDPVNPNYEFDAASQLAGNDDAKTKITPFLKLKRVDSEAGVDEEVGAYLYYIDLADNYLTDCDYEIAILQNNSNLVIQKAPLEIEVTNNSKMYKQTDPAPFTFTVTDTYPLKNGDTAADVDAVVKRAVNETTEKLDEAVNAHMEGTGANAHAVVNENAQAYAFALAQEATNYSITFANGFLIVPSNDYSGIAVTVKNNKENTPEFGKAEYVYRGTEYKPGTEGTEEAADLIVTDGQNELTQGVDYTIKSYTNNVHARTDAAKAKVTVSLTGSYVAKDVDGEFTIKKAPLTINAKSYELTAGAADPSPFEVEYTGWVNNEGTTAAPATGDNAPKDFKAPSEVTKTAIAGSTGSILKVKQDAEAADYAIKYEDGAISFGELVLIVNANDASKTFGAKDPELSVTVKTSTGAEATEAQKSNLSMGGKLCYTISREAGENVGGGSNANGTYPITVEGPTVLLDNVLVVYNPGEFAINRKTVYLRGDACTKVYGDANPAFEASVWETTGEGDAATTTKWSAEKKAAEGVANQTFYYVGVEGASWNGSAWVLASEDATPANGGYAVTATVRTGRGTPNGITTSGNYYVVADSENNGKFTITKAPLTIAADNLTQTYGESPKTLTVTATGLKRNDKIYENTDYTISRAEGTDVKDGGYAITVNTVATSVASGTLKNYDPIKTTGAVYTIEAADFAVIANDQAIGYGGKIDPYDVTIVINGEDQEWTKEQIEKVLNLTTTVKSVGFNKDAYTLNLVENANYKLDETLNENGFVKGFKNGWLTIGQLKVIPLAKTELAKITDIPLHQVLEDHKGMQVKVILTKRTIYENEWSDWVLPFEVNPRDFFSNFYTEERPTRWGYGAIDVLDPAKSKNGQIVFDLKMGNIPANTPFLVKVDEEISSAVNGTIEFDGVTIADKDAEGNEIFYADAEGKAVNPVVAANDGSVKFVGLYDDKTGVNSNEMALMLIESIKPNWEFYRGDDNQPNMQGYRLIRSHAFLQFPSAAAAGGARIYIQEPDGTYTAINGVEADADATNAEGIYNLSGQRVNKAQKGIYIQNGKKVLVK
jgi:hypothetical protein